MRPVQMVLLFVAGLLAGFVPLPQRTDDAMRPGPFASQARAAEDDMAALQERFRKRYPALLREIRAGRIGETHEGYVEAVKPDDVRGEENEARRTLIAQENADRQTLYRLLAEQQKTTPELVARRNAQRNFKEAAAGDYLKPEGSGWVTKAQWAQSQQQK